MSVALGVVQMAMSDVLEENVSRAIELVREAASRGATAVLLPELFEGYYWQQAQREPVREVKNDRLVDPQAEC